MKNITFTCLLIAVLASVASAQVTEPTFYSVVPAWLQAYFNAMDLWLIAIFWKYIMYGTFYVLVDQVYCRFFPLALDSILSGLSDLLANTLSEEDAKAACMQGFWVWYDAEFYPGSPSNQELIL